MKDIGRREKFPSSALGGIWLLLFASGGCAAILCGKGRCGSLTAGFARGVKADPGKPAFVCHASQTVDKTDPSAEANRLSNRFCSEAAQTRKKTILQVNDVIVSWPLLMCPNTAPLQKLILPQCCQCAASHSELMVILTPNRSKGGTTADSGWCIFKTEPENKINVLILNSSIYM